MSEGFFPTSLLSSFFPNSASWEPFQWRPELSCSHCRSCAISQHCLMTPHVYTSGCGWTPTCTYTYTRACTHAHTCACTHTHTCVHTHTCAHTHTCMHTHAHTCTHTHTHTHTHAHTHCFGCVDLMALTLSMSFPASRVCSCDPHASVPVETTRLPLKCNCEERGPKLSLLHGVCFRNVLFCLCLPFLSFRSQAFG